MDVHNKFLSFIWKQKINENNVLFILKCNYVLSLSFPKIILTHNVVKNV